MKTKINLISLLIILLTLNCFTASSQVQNIGVKIPEVCTTDCSDPFNLEIIITFIDAYGKKCDGYYYGQYSQTTTYWIDATNCEVGFIGPPGTVKIEVKFFDQYNTECCYKYVEEHWYDWGDTFIIEMD
ncbi:MAG TPA: hypothetical protein P5531_14630 [Bacteroidales bacterium]|nr:hypothetical protein [Bacteroidales bacterium]HSA44829.1 hypothetical protein [Bacteroidales bacterium]